MKLNLGSGTAHKLGFINVDKFPPADVVLDLEGGPWPWGDNQVEEVLMHHSLEHMGETTQGFFHIIKELYRVCRNDAKINIVVPHPRNDDFLNDPTHVRPITPDMLNLFSLKSCNEWALKGIPNTPLARHLDVNFEIVSCEALVEDYFSSWPGTKVREYIPLYNNMIKQYDIWLKVIK